MFGEKTDSEQFNHGKQGETSNKSHGDKIQNESTLDKWRHLGQIRNEILNECPFRHECGEWWKSGSGKGKNKHGARKNWHALREPAHNLETSRMCGVNHHTSTHK